VWIVLLESNGFDEDEIDVEADDAPKLSVDW